MKKTLSLLVVLMAAGFAIEPAEAANHYISGMGGISWMDNIKTEDTYVRDPLLGSNNSKEVALDSGIAALGAIGCDYGNYRLEAEIGYQKNNVNSQINSHNGIAYTHPSDAVGTSGSRYEMKGDVSVMSLLANGYYDFQLGSRFELYATAGAGVAQISLHDVNQTGNWNANGNGYLFVPFTNPGYTGNETTLAWQVGAGIAAPISDNIMLDLRYRYFATTDCTLSDYGWDTNSSNINVSSHSVLLGLRVDF